MDTPETDQFEELLDEGASAPVEGWDFSWFEGRATEERPSWGYSRLLAGRMAAAAVALDIQTGGGEVLAGVPHLPPVLVATESWPPNAGLSARNLSQRARVVRAADDGGLPFRTETFDLVVSRHPVVVVWEEVARVLAPGGTYLSQEVGPGSNRGLSDFLMGPQPVSDARSARRAVTSARGCGLDIVDLREQALRIEFYDIAAVVHFLRKVVWTVPGFTVARYRDRLLALHQRIQAEGRFVCHSQRFLIEARKPR